VTSVFEAVDSTNEETYWSLGVWPTLEYALAAFTDCQDPGDFGCHNHNEHDDLCVIEIRERSFGWGGPGIPRATLRWENMYDEAADEFKWRRTE